MPILPIVHSKARSPRAECTRMSDFIALSRFLGGISATDVAAILAQATPRRFRPESVITRQGDPANELFLITKGRARHFVTAPDGQKVLLLWLPVGEIFGGAALLAERSTYRVSTEAVKDTTALVWSRLTILALAERYPRIRDNALWIASDYLDWYLAAHIALSCHTASRRLAGVLVSMAPLLGRSVPGGLEIDVTNEELASAAHITSFTASRLLSEWHRRRAVIKRRGRVVLVAPDQLIRMTA
jgi:CRP/FNR family transcriptional regulator, nitrogen oxide reductase regulator